MLNEQVKGEGEVEKKALEIGALHGIIVDGPMDVELSAGPVQSVIVEAQPNIAALLNTEVKDGIWTITTSKGFSTKKPFVLHISVPEIDMVEVEGSGEVNGNGVFTTDALHMEVDGSGSIMIECEARAVDASVSGSGNIRVTGSCTSLELEVGGSGDIDARGLRAVDARAAISGSGDIALQATGVVDASVNGSGDIEVHGSPADVRRNVTGSGEVRTMPGQ